MVVNVKYRWPIRIYDYVHISTVGTVKYYTFCINMTQRVLDHSPDPGRGLAVRGHLQQSFKCNLNINTRLYYFGFIQWISKVGYRVLSFLLIAKCIKWITLMVMKSLDRVFRNIYLIIIYNISRTLVIEWIHLRIFEISWGL